MKRVIATLIVLIFFAPVVLFAAGQEEDGTFLIGAAMSSFSDKWQTYLQDGIREFDAEYDDVEIQMTDGKDDPALQLSQVETLITQGIDALVIVPVDISALGPIIDATEAADIPIVAVNRIPGEEFLSRVDLYVGSESIDAGLLQAEWIAEAMQPEGGKIGIMQGPLGHEAARMRTTGNKEIFDKYDNVEIIVEGEGKWDRALGQQIAENWIQAYPDLRAIVANNDEMAIGALLAAQSSGISDEDLFIGGVDATPDALEYLGKGLDVTVFQSAHGQGYGSLEATYKLLNGESIDQLYWIPFELVTPENMADYQ